MSQQELADAISMDRACVSLLENGKRRVLAEDLSNFAQALDCKITDFFTEEELNIKKSGWNNYSEGDFVSFIDQLYLVRYKEGCPVVAIYRSISSEFYLNDTRMQIPLKVDQYCEIPE
jgi:transcriptional regulator with XRE-family HTH domain